MRTRSLTRYLLPLSLLLAAAACDSGGDDPSDAERFVGDWAASAARVGEEGSAVDLIGASGPLSGLTATFTDSTVAFVLGYAAAADQTLSGAYRVDEAVDLASFALRVPGAASTLPFGSRYAFDGDALTLSLPASVLGFALTEALGPDAPTLGGDVTLRLER